MNKSYIIAGVILIGSVAWIMSGMGTSEQATNITPAQEQQEQGAEVQKAAPTVQTQISQAQEVISDITVNGQTEASRKVELRSEITGQVRDVLAERGQAVKKGDVIVQMETNDRLATVASARELVKKREIEYNAAKNLADKGFNSKIRLAGAKADLEEAKTNLKRAEIDVANLKIKAPFDGILETRPVERGSYLSMNTLVGTLVDLDPVRVVAYVSEQHIGRIKTGDAAFAILPNGMEFQGKISYLATTAEQQTRTFRTELEIENPDHNIVEGLTTKLRIPTTKQWAHKISPAILTLDDLGSVGVKAVDENNQVAFFPVTTLKTDQDGLMWVQGLPDQVRLVIVGQDFVIAGQTVTPVDQAKEMEQTEQPTETTNKNQGQE